MFLVLLLVVVVAEAEMREQLTVSFFPALGHFPQHVPMYNRDLSIESDTIRWKSGGIRWRDQCAFIGRVFKVVRKQQYWFVRTRSFMAFGFCNGNDVLCIIWTRFKVFLFLGLREG